MTGEASPESDASQAKWPQSTGQTTGDSDVESAISNDSGLGFRSKESDSNSRAQPVSKTDDEDFQDLQLDVDVQELRANFHQEAEAISRILGNIQVTGQASVPWKISQQLRRYSKSIVAMFGDDTKDLNPLFETHSTELKLLVQIHAELEALEGQKVQLREQINNNEEAHAAALIQLKSASASELDYIREEKNAEILALHQEKEASKVRFESSICDLTSKLKSKDHQLHAASIAQRELKGEMTNMEEENMRLSQELGLMGQALQQSGDALKASTKKEEQYEKERSIARSQIHQYQSRMLQFQSEQQQATLNQAGKMNKVVGVQEQYSPQKSQDTVELSKEVERPQAELEAINVVIPEAILKTEALRKLRRELENMNDTEAEAAEFIINGKEALNMMVKEEESIELVEANKRLNNELSNLKQAHKELGNEKEVLKEETKKLQGLLTRAENDKDILLYQFQELKTSKTVVFNALSEAQSDMSGYQNQIAELLTDLEKLKNDHEAEINAYSNYNADLEKHCQIIRVQMEARLENQVLLFEDIFESVDKRGSFLPLCRDLMITSAKDILQPFLNFGTFYGERKTDVRASDAVDKNLEQAVFPEKLAVIRAKLLDHVRQDNKSTEEIEQLRKDHSTAKTERNAAIEQLWNHRQKVDTLGEEVKNLSRENAELKERVEVLRMQNENGSEAFQLLKEGESLLEETLKSVKEQSEKATLAQKRAFLAEQKVEEGEKKYKKFHDRMEREYVDLLRRTTDAGPPSGELFRASF